MTVSLNIDLLNQIQAMIYITDQNHHFMMANNFTAKALGYLVGSELEGRCYFDMRCPAVQYSDIFIKQDQQIFQQKKNKKYLAYCCYSNNNWKVLLGDKSIIVNGKNASCLSNFIELSQCRSILNLYEIISKSSEDHFLSDNGQFVYEIIDDENVLSLTKREQECLFYFLRGRAAKEIANYLNISYRTVESYIDNIKTKWSCHSRSDLYDMAIRSGFLGIVPASIINNIR